MTRTYAIYDTETSGAEPTFDQILQAAGILYDGQFRELETLNERSRILPYVVPSPKALEVTGVHPDQLEDPAAFSPYDFARHLHDVFSRWSPAIFLGYNIVKFDEEIVRQTFYRNLLFPYVTNSRGAKRADLLIMMRALSAIHPGLFEIPLNDEGKESFRLEHIAPANGFQDMDAHDALGDVRATAYMAEICATRAPEAWEHLLSLAEPRGCDEVIAEGELMLTTHFGQSETHHCAVVASCPSNPKQVGAFDLSHDPAPYLDLSAEQLAEAMATDFRILRTIKTNQQPVIFSVDSHLAPAITPKTDEDGTTLEIPDETVRAERLQRIQDHPTFRIRFAEALQIRADSFKTEPDANARPKQPEEQIYGGFLQGRDKGRQTAFTNARDWEERWAIACAFDDQRHKRLARRVVLSEAPEVVDPETARKAMARMYEERVLTQEDVPWNTLAKARAGLAEIADPQMRSDIAAWLDRLEATARAAVAAAEESDTHQEAAAAR